MTYGESVPGDMPDAPQTESDRNLFLRLQIREAVERELMNQLAPLRTTVQTYIGRTDQLNRDYGALRAMVDDLRAVINGDPALGIKGLLATVDDIKSALAKQTDTLKNQGIYIRVGFATLIALGMLDNERIVKFLGSILSAMIGQ